MTKYPKYSKLESTLDYDHEAAEELAKALNELNAIKNRIGTLTELINDNHALHEFTWTTAEGEAKAVHDIDDDHLKNILQFLFNHHRTINKVLKSEARRRGFEIPTKAAEIVGPYETARQLLEGEIIENDYNRDHTVRDTDIPF